MQIDKASFFILVFTLGAGGAGGYFASEKHLFRPPPPPPAPTPPPTPPPPPASTAPPPKPTPTCDDMVGAPGACPPPGWPTEEGGCGGLATKRCEDFKQAMRPRVAERAVACINALPVNQRCDPLRLSLCGHASLMGACGVEGVDFEAAPDAAADDISSHCSTILHGCDGVSPGPTLRDCRATLAGMTMLGRDKMVSCMKTHCTDKGLLYCEGVVDVK
jgi:hypothetical protein